MICDSRHCDQNFRNFKKNFNQNFSIFYLFNLLNFCSHFLTPRRIILDLHFFRPSFISLIMSFIQNLLTQSSFLNSGL